MGAVTRVGDEGDFFLRVDAQASGDGGTRAGSEFSRVRRGEELRGGGVFGHGRRAFLREDAAECRR